MHGHESAASAAWYDHMLHSGTLLVPMSLHSIVGCDHDARVYIVIDDQKPSLVLRGDAAVVYVVTN